MIRAMCSTQLKKWQKPMEKYAFPLFLLLWPLVGANQGISVSDTTYSLVNYRYLFEGTGSTWLFATWLANLSGHLLSLLPAGHTMLGMNLMTALVISATALSVYYVMQRIIPGWMLFFGEFLAIALCWGPSVILYNYLTYFFLTAGVLFLFLGMSSVPEKKRYWILAGLCLGINVTVRFSNLCEAALILAVWFGTGISGKAGGAGERRTAALHRTLLCLAGYLAGFAAGILPAVLLYGGKAYFAMIPQLFGMTATAKEYTAGGMIALTFDAWMHAMHWFLILVPCVFMGIILFLLPEGRTRAGKTAARLLYAAGICVVIRFFYARGMFTLNYQDYWCMFEWGMLLLIIALILSVCGMCGIAGGAAEERFLSSMVLILLLIIPLGSNNYTFPLLNCLFVIAPYTLWMLRRYMAASKGSRQARFGFPWQSMAAAVILMTFIQGTLFHCCFAFGDGTDGTRRTAYVANSRYLAGMQTTPYNAEVLSGLCGYLENSSSAGQSVIAFGNAPGISVICSIPPALSTSWPDLDSYPYDRMEAEMENMTEEPVIVFRNAKDAAEPTEAAVQKEELLRDYMTARHYGKTYENAEYQVWQAP